VNDVRFRRAFASLATVGIGVAGYLTDVHYAGLAPICGISHGCETVQSSPYAFLAGIPVALLGLIAYLVLLGSSLFAGERALFTGFGLSLVGFAFSAYLTYREVFTIHAICSWCVTSAIVFTLLAAVSAARVLARRSALATRPALATTDARPGGELASR
jgi:uncharacterized membrane protein